MVGSSLSSYPALISYHFDYSNWTFVNSTAIHSACYSNQDANWDFCTAPTIAEHKAIIISMVTKHTTSAYSPPCAAAAASGRKRRQHIGYYNLILNLFVRMIHQCFRFDSSNLCLGYSF